MKPKKVMLAFGTRPEAIKMAPLHHALKSNPNEFSVLTCVTGQHRQMLDQVLSIFDIRPDIDLNLMRPGQDLFDITSSVLISMRGVLSEHRPDILLVHGDTTTSFAAALAAFYSGIQIGHVEAGLRTYDLKSPFPEEFNRQITGRLANLHFAPTENSRNNLLKENVNPETISVTGNTVIDALFWILRRLENNPNRRESVAGHISQQLTFNWQKSKFVLITGHRRENFGDGFIQICNSIKALSTKYPFINFVYPVHLNPNVQGPVNSILKNIPNIHLISPLDYEPFVYLLKHAYLVLTDSGGVQEEAPSLGIPVLVMRDVTERPEAVAAGTVRLVGANFEQIVSNVSELINDEHSYNDMSYSHNPYGDGQACQKIIEKIKVM